MIIYVTHSYNYKDEVNKRIYSICGLILYFCTLILYEKVSCIDGGRRVAVFVQRLSEIVEKLGCRFEIRKGRRVFRQGRLHACADLV